MNRYTEYLKSIISLSEHLDVAAAGANIRKNIAFRGPNVYILACAIIIASVGLNVNSIPVIIGAMLISPLMSPIIGFGLGLGTSDDELMRSSLKNFAVMVVISILASTIYFFITPLKLNEPTELLARTNPTIYDVLIALFGGFAGTLETTRKEKGTVMSGVAIATALMPPLCTAGYGIAVLNIHYLTGALYLFTINSIFIALSVFISAKYLGFEPVKYEDQEKKARLRKRVWAIVAILIIPSCWSAFNIIKENNFSVNAENLVRKYKTIGASYIYDYKVHTDVRPYNIEVFIAGEGLNEAQKEIIYIDGESIGLTRQQIFFRQDAADNTKMTEAEIVRGIQEYYDGRIQELNRTIQELQTELARYKPADAPAAGADSSAVNSPSEPQSTSGK
ncbi:MAG: TIGR00341 family protein [Bacteroidales bacterium]|nr:TIGR00341 family protein [Bacteroidales bacterium]